MLWKSKDMGKKGNEAGKTQSPKPEKDTDHENKGFDPMNYTDMETYFCPECHSRPCVCDDNI